jgi:hypothetical protein
VADGHGIHEHPEEAKRLNTSLKLCKDCGGVKGSKWLTGSFAARIAF